MEKKETIEREISKEELEKYMDAKYLVKRVVPFADNPKILEDVMTREQIAEYLEGYDRYAEFIVSVEIIE